MDNINEPKLTDSTGGDPIIIMADMPVSPAALTPTPAKSVLDWTKFVLPGAILIAAVMISGSILYARLSAGTAAIGNNQAQQAAAGKPVNVDVGKSPVLGNAKAPVTVVEFGDFQCPFCERYFQTNQTAIINDYVNAGKVRFVWKDYAFLGQESIWAAEAARCATDQGKFWQYHDYLYAHQGAENSGAFSKAKLIGFAGAVGLNVSSFTVCLNSDRHAADVQKDTDYGTSIGVTGTPATFVNGVLISGAVPYAQLQSAIDAALKK